MNFEEYQRQEDSYRFCRTTIGLVGFIVCFLGAFFAFIAAEENENYHAAIIISGFILLCVTAAFFCCVLHESKLVFDLREPSDGVERVPLVSQPESIELQQRQHLEIQDEDNLRWPTDDSEDTIDSENNSDPDMQALLKMKKSGLPAEAKESASGTSKSSQDIGSTSSGGKSIDVELDSSNAGPSKVADRSSEVIESRSNISQLRSRVKPLQSDSDIGETTPLDKTEST